MMISTGTAAKAAKTVVTGMVGVAAFDLAKAAVRATNGHDLVVTSVALGLRGVRTAEKGAEAVRLRTADIVAEARDRIGEQAPAPGATSDGHEH